MAGADGETAVDPSENGGLWAWPSAVARWLLGTGLDSGRGRATAGPVARFRNICVSREAGAGGGTLARLVGTRLDWKVYDHELLEAIAHGMEVPTDEARTYDELAPGLVQDWLLPLREEHYAPQEAYLDHLAKLVESIGKAGDSIIVGRGASQMLPRSETLCVRIVAPLKARAKNLAARMGVSQRTGRKAAIERDRRVAKFVKTLHRVDVADPHLYDLVLDTESLGLSIATELVVTAVRMGMPAKLGSEVVVSSTAGVMP
jgi:cytidylate kinase